MNSRVTQDNGGRKQMHTKRMWVMGCALALLLALLTGPLTTRPAHAAPPPPLDEEQILIVGMEPQPSPAEQVVPRNTGTIVTPLLVRSDGATGAELPALPDDALFLAELRGPAFGTPVILSAQPNQPFIIPPLPLNGTYTLSNIRLTSGGQTLMEANPDTATIEVIERVLVSQVTSRPLTAEEIRDKGIVIDQTNFQVVNFTVAFGLEGERVTVDFPMILPANKQNANIPGYPIINFPRLSPAEPPEGVLPGLARTIQVPNISLTGFSLEAPAEAGDIPGLVDAIPGVVIIPGNVAYLNQFFSVMLKVSNVAPQNSNLVVSDLEATIVLPTGNDTVPDTSDDPLRMARLGAPATPQPKTQPIVQPGPDGALGTEDDIVTVAPGQSGDAEFLVEGRKEGVHTVDIEITATLNGLPGGPIPLKGRARGIVEVRNPTFALTFNHPATVSANDSYDFNITVTNISDTPANFVSLSLLANSISGAELLSDPVVQVETIPAGESATVTFRLKALTTGTVTSSSYDSDGVPGRFQLRMGVGDLGIPMSPNTLVLPPPTENLPSSLREAGLSLLSQAHALASAPTTPQGLLPMGTSIVYERASDLAAAGQRVGLGELLPDMGRDLALDFLGNGYTRLGERFEAERSLASTSVQQTPLEQAEQDYRGFDSLLRRSNRGAAFLDLLGGYWATLIGHSDVLTFQNNFAEAATSRPAHLSVIAGDGNGGAPVLLNLTDPNGARLGVTGVGASPLREVPFGAFFALMEDGANRSQMLLNGVPQDGAYAVEIIGTGNGAFDLGLIVPEPDGLHHVRFIDVPIRNGARGRVTFAVGSANEYRLLLDTDGDGTEEQIAPASGADSPLADTGPRLLSALQLYTGERDGTRFGQVIGLLFNEEVSPISAQNMLEPEEITNYLVDGNQVRGVRVQPGGRVVLLGLRDGIGPFVPRGITVKDITDRFDHPMEVMAEPVPIATADNLPPGGTMEGTVRQPDGTPVPFAPIALYYIDEERNLLTGERYEYLVTVKNSDAEGHYSFDWIDTADKRIEFMDPQGGEKGRAFPRIRFNGHRLEMDLILIGTGTVTGRVYAADGETPLAGAEILIKSPLNVEIPYYTRSDENGAYVIPKIPVGSISIQAAHVPSSSKVLLAGLISANGETVVQDLILYPVSQEYPRGDVEGYVVREDDSPAIGIPVYSAAGGVVTTDEEGYYRIEGLPAGSVLIRAIDQVLMETGDVHTTVVADQTVGANIRLHGGAGTITGVVQEANGEPLEGIAVYGGPTLVYTDEDGAFTMINVPIGPVRLTAWDERDPLNVRTIEERVTLAHDNETIEVLMEMPAQGTLSGVVRDSNGEPVAGIKVFAYGPRNDKTISNERGEYHFKYMPLGKYTVAAFRDDFSDGNFRMGELAAQDQPLALDVTFRGKGSVSGTVFNDRGDTPVGARVGLSEWVVVVGRLIPMDNTECLPDIYVDGKLVLDRTDCEQAPVRWEYRSRSRIVNSNVESGAFTFSDVFVGNFLVEAANPFSPGTVSQAGTIGAPGESVSVTLSLQSTGVVTGTIFQPDGVTPVGKEVIVTMDTSYIKGVRVVTDENGVYHFPLVPAGGFTLTAEDPASGLVARTNGAVQPGQTVNLSLRLLREGSVTVTVQGANGPVENATVWLTEGNYPNRRHEGVTGPEGTITFSGGTAPVEGSFSVLALKDGIRGAASGVIRGVVDSPDGHVDLTVTLGDDAGTVEGRFLRSDGVTPIPNAQISVNGMGTQAYTTTGTDGAYRFEGVRVGNFTLNAYDPATGRRGKATGEITENDETVTLDMVQVAQGTVTGTARWEHDGSPAAGAEVTLSSSGVLGGQLRTTASPGGTFTFPGVSAGNFTVVVTVPGSGERAIERGALSEEGQTVPLDVTIRRAPVGRVEGRVFKVDGEPAQFATVRLSGPKFGGALTTVNNQGYYFFDNVPPGSYTVRVTEEGSADTGQATGEVLGAGDVATINVQFIGLGRVVGVVQTADNPPEPVANVRVDLSRNGSVIPPFYSANTFSKADGSFVFEGVPVGAISLSTLQGSTGLAGNATGTIPAAGETLTLTLTLEQAGSLRGRVLHESGEPAALVALSVKLSNSNLTRYGSTSDEEGNEGYFEFDDLKLGSYTLSVSDPFGTGIATAQFTLDEQGEVVDLGEIRLDSAPPRVLSVSPANGQVDVPVTQSIEVTFSEPVLPATVNTTNLVVSNASGAIAGAWSLNAAGNVATFTRESGTFNDLEQITVRVLTNVKDYAGRNLIAQVLSTFTTTDTTPPSVTSLEPAAGATGILTESVVHVSYSEVIDLTSFSPLADAIIVRRNGARVAGSVEAAPGNNGIVFWPAQPLFPDSTYEVMVAPATDLHGNAQSEGMSYSFTTIDVQAPVIETIVVSPGTTIRVGETGTFTVTLEDSDIEFVEFFVNGASRAVDQEAPYTFALPITEEMPAEVEIGAQATDTSGNVSDPAFTTLTIVPDNPPQISITAPAAGTVVANGQKVAVTVEGNDDVGLKTFFFRASGEANVTRSHNVPAQAPEHTHSFELIVPFSALAEGVVELQASAVDTRDQTTDSDVITVTVRDNAPPAVDVLSPAYGTTVEPGSVVPVHVEVSDNGVIQSIRLTASGGATFDETRVISPTVAITDVTFFVPMPANANATQTVNLTAIARDGAGRTTQRGWQLKIQDIVPPQVLLGLPGGMTEVAPGESFLASVSATDHTQLDTLRLSVTGAMSDTQLFAVPVTSPPTTSKQKTFTVQVPSDAPVGEVITIVGSATDRSGNEGTSSPGTLTIGIKANTVTGVVTDAQGNAVPGAEIVVTSTAGIHSGTANAEGEYEVPGIGAGEVKVVALDPATGLRGSASGVLALGESSTEVNVALPAAPEVALVAPTDGDTVIVGATLVVSATAQSTVGISGVRFSVAGTTVLTDSTAPYQHTLTVPAGAPVLALGVVAYDNEGNESAEQAIEVNVITDPNTTVVGQVVDGGGAGVPGATVRIAPDLSATAEADGTFTIPDVPTINGPIQVRANGTVSGVALQGRSGAVAPISGGTTDVGIITAGEVKVWDGGGGNSAWLTAANWSGDTLPGPTDHVYIPEGASVNLGSGSASIRSLTLDGSLLLSSLATADLTIAEASEVNGTLRLRNATVTGAADIAVNGTWLWQFGGVMTGSGTTTVTKFGTLTIDIQGNGGITLGRILNLEGTTTWLDGYSNYMSLSDDAVLTNLAGATFTLADRKSFIRTGSSGTPQVINYGVIHKPSGNEHVRFDSNTRFFNHGMVIVDRGEFQMEGGGAHTGSFIAGTDTYVDFGKRHTLESASSLMSKGEVRFTSVDATPTLLSGSFTAARTSFRGGTTTLDRDGIDLGPTITLVNNSTVNFNKAYDARVQELNLSGTVNFSTGGRMTIESFNFNFGTVLGSDTLDIVDMIWKAGTMESGGESTVFGTLDLQMSQPARVTIFRTLNLAGTTTWSTAGSVFYLGTGGELNNLAGATFTLSGSSKSFFRLSGTTGTVHFNNAGTLRKTTGTGNVTIASNVAFNNTGTVIVDTSRMIFQGGFTQASSGALILNNISGTTVGTEMPRAEVTGLATLDGALQVNLADGYQPTGGDHVVLTYTSRSGEFASIEDLVIGNGYQFEPAYNPANLTLSVLPAPEEVTIE